MMRNGPMTAAPRQIDEAAFGVVYGSITVMAFLMAMHHPIEAPGKQALVLFGTVAVVAVAKAYAEICERVLKSGKPADWTDIRAAWTHSQTVLLAANGPAVAFALSWAGVYDTAVALTLAQVLAIGVLAYFGARIGWRVRGTALSGIVGAGLTGGLGFAISLLKYVTH